MGFRKTLGSPSATYLGTNVALRVARLPGSHCLGIAVYLAT